MALWVSRVDEVAVHNTQDVDVLIRREDFDAAKAALESAGFVYLSPREIPSVTSGPPTASCRRSSTDGASAGLGPGPATDCLQPDAAVKRWTAGKSAYRLH